MFFNNNTIIFIYLFLLFFFFFFFYFLNFNNVQLNDPMTNSLAKYAHNRISTAKYNVFTFLYKFLKEQFSKYANVFFLVTAIIQVI